MKNLLTLFIAFTSVFSIGHLYAQTDQGDYKNKAELIFQYNRLGLGYQRSMKSFDIRANVNKLFLEPEKAQYSFFAGGPNRVASIGKLPYDAFPDSIVNDTVYSTPSLVSAREWDARLGFSYTHDFDKISLTAGVDGVIGILEVFETITEAVIYERYDSTLAMTFVKGYSLDHATNSYSYLKIGCAPFVGVQIPINRWSVGILYNPEISWLSELSGGYARFIRIKSPLKRFSVKDQIALNVGFSF